MKLKKPTLTINLEVIRSNYRVLRQLCKTSKVGAAVKANCYGLGVKQIAPILEEEGCEYFFVANKDEGIELRSILKKQNSNIYVLNCLFENDTDKKDFLEYEIVPVLTSMSHVKIWGNANPCVIHFDTGMNRLGMHHSKIDEILQYNLHIAFIMSHLSSAEDFFNSANAKQLELFQKITTFFPNTKKSFANSSGIFLGLDYQYDITRPGAAIYGINPAPYLAYCPIENPISLMAPIVQIAKVTNGEFVGYNATYKTTRSTVIATIPIGYGDGYFRSLSNKGSVFVNGLEAKVIGRVSMDLITVDVTDVPERDLCIGQVAEIIGPNMSPDKIANISGTNAYEILTMFGDRYQKIYV